MNSSRDQRAAIGRVAAIDCCAADVNPLQLLTGDAPLPVNTRATTTATQTNGYVPTVVIGILRTATRRPLRIPAPPWPRPHRWST